MLGGDRSKLAKYPIFPPGTKSLLCKYLTPDVFEALCDRVTPGGITFQASVCVCVFVCVCVLCLCC